MQYQNISTHDQNLIGFGVVQAGSTIETDRTIENPNFRLMGSETAPIVASTPVSTPEPEPTPQLQPVQETPQENNQPNN